MCICPCNHYYLLISSITWSYIQVFCTLQEGNGTCPVPYGCTRDMCRETDLYPLSVARFLKWVLGSQFLSGLRVTASQKCPFSCHPLLLWETQGHNWSVPAACTQRVSWTALVSSTVPLTSQSDLLKRCLFGSCLLTSLETLKAD